MLRGGLARAIPGIAADADTSLPPLPGNSRNGSAGVTPVMPHGRLRYDIDARFGARRRASVSADSRGPVVDSVLIAGRAGTAAAGSARNQRCGVPGGAASCRAGSTAASWLRELMPSLVKTFRRW
jgi:hypothetical protein